MCCKHLPNSGDVNTNADWSKGAKHHFKNEYIFTRAPTSFAETKLIIAEAVKHYNKDKFHFSLGYITSKEFRNMFMEKFV